MHGSSVNNTYCSSQSPKRRSALLHYPESREKGGCDIHSGRLYTACACRHLACNQGLSLRQFDLISSVPLEKKAIICRVVLRRVCRSLEMPAVQDCGTLGHWEPWHLICGTENQQKVPIFAFPFTKGSSGSQ